MIFKRRVVDQIFSDKVKIDALANFAGQALGRQDLVIDKMFTMSGGAIQENWRLEYHCSLGDNGRLVIRADAKTSVPGSHTKRHEFEILSHAWKAGIKVPKPLALCEDEDLIGRCFILMEHLPGTTDFDQIRSLGSGEELAYELGAEIARLHQVKPDELPFLNKALTSPVEELISQYRRFFDEREKPNPVAEWAMRWCLMQQEEALHPLPQVFVHGDFRTANYLVTPEGVTGLLDWEFAGWGDPYSDLGWFCTKCWRYGHESKPAGGIASRKNLYRGYASISGEEVDSCRVLFWEVMSLLRWLVIAIQQGDRNFIAGEKDLELGLTGLVRPPEIEMMLLEMTTPDCWPELVVVDSAEKDICKRYLQQIFENEKSETHNFCDQLVIQADQLVEGKNLSGTELTLNETRAVQRIVRIAETINSASINQVKAIKNDPVTCNVTGNIRLAFCDGDPELYEKLYRHTQSKLKLISPESLRGYVGLLD